MVISNLIIYSSLGIIGFSLQIYSNLSQPIFKKTIGKHLMYIMEKTIMLVTLLLRDLLSRNSLKMKWREITFNQVWIFSPLGV